MKKQRSKIFKKKLKENYKKQSLAIFIIDEKPVFKDMKNDFPLLKDEFPKWKFNRRTSKRVIIYRI